MLIVMADQTGKVHAVLETIELIRVDEIERRLFKKYSKDVQDPNSVIGERVIVTRINDVLKERKISYREVVVQYLVEKYNCTSHEFTVAKVL